MSMFSLHQQQKNDRHRLRKHVWLIKYNARGKPEAPLGTQTSRIKSFCSLFSWYHLGATPSAVSEVYLDGALGEYLYFFEWNYVIISKNIPFRPTFHTINTSTINFHQKLFSWENAMFDIYKYSLKLCSFFWSNAHV